MPIIDVGGIQSVGKSTLIELAKNSLDFEVEIIKRSEILSNIIKNMKNDEKSESLSNNHALAMRLFVDSKNDCIRDTHFTSFEPEKIIYKVRASEIGKVAVAVLVVAPIDMVLERRKKNTRYRSVDVDIIKEQMDLEESGAKYFARTLQVPLIKISNDNLISASQELKNVIYDYYQN